MVDYGFDQWSVESFVILIYSETVYIFSYTDVLHANIFSSFMGWK